MSADFLNFFFLFVATIGMAFLAGYNSGRAVERKTFREAFHAMSDKIKQLTGQIERSEAAKR